MDNKNIINYEVVLESKHIYYVKLSMDLINEYLLLFNNPNIRRFLSCSFEPYTYEDEVKYINQISTSLSSFVLSMIDKESGKFIGNIDFKNIILNETAELGLVINEDFQSKHYGSEAIKAFLDYGFDVLNFKEVYLVTYSNNIKARNCALKLGFEEYKVIRDVAIINGESVDDIYMKINR